MRKNFSIRNGMSTSLVAILGGFATLEMFEALQTNPVIVFQDKREIKKTNVDLLLDSLTGSDRRSS